MHKENVLLQGILKIHEHILIYIPNLKIKVYSFKCLNVNKTLSLL